MIHHLSTERVWLLEPNAYLQLAALPPPSSIPASLPAAPPPACHEEGGLATVSIKGMMMRQAPAMLQKILTLSGIDFCETAPLARMLGKLAADSAVKAVLLDIDSPGGTVNGTPELAAAIRRLSKDKYVYAYTAGMACSAAYWAASQCDGIYAAPSSRLGSVGVIMPLVDSTGAFARNGLKVDVFAAGRYKSAGLSGTSLTEGQRDLLQAQVDAIWGQFKADVARRRRTIAPGHLEGQTFTGTEARAAGLVDACADTLEAVQEKLRLRHQ